MRSKQNRQYIATGRNMDEDLTDLNLTLDIRKFTNLVTPKHQGNPISSNVREPASNDRLPRAGFGNKDSAPRLTNGLFKIAGQATRALHRGPLSTL